MVQEDCPEISLAAGFYGVDVLLPGEYGSHQQVFHQGKDLLERKMK